MFTRDRSGTDPVRFSDRIGLLFTRDRSGTGPERIQNWTCCFAGPVSDPIRTGSRKVPCKHLDRFQTVPCKQKPIWSGSVRNGSGPVPCKRSLKMYPLDKTTRSAGFHAIWYLLVGVWKERSQQNRVWNQWSHWHFVVGPKVWTFFI